LKFRALFGLPRDTTAALGQHPDQVGEWCGKDDDEEHGLVQGQVDGDKLAHFDRGGQPRDDRDGVRGHGDQVVNQEEGEGPPGHDDDEAAPLLGIGSIK
jgi:hypothetical protein